MKTYCRRLGVIAYQNTQDNTPLFKKYFKKVKDLGLNISRNSDKLKIEIFLKMDMRKHFTFIKMIGLFLNLVNLLNIPTKNLKNYLGRFDK